MSFKIEWFDLERILTTVFNVDKTDARIIADYLEECIDYELNLTYYLWNTLPYNVHCFDTEEEALDFIDNENLKQQDCIIVEFNSGVYLEIK